MKANKYLDSSNRSSQIGRCRKSACLFGLIFILFLALPLHRVAQADVDIETNRKNILILNSYHPGYGWSDNIVGGIRGYFRENSFDVNFHVEYMDTKRFFGNEYLKSLYDYYLIKYQNTKFDLIITSDDNAFNFVQNYYARLFKDTPVVYCGLNSTEDFAHEIQSSVTGVGSTTEVIPTIELIQKLHPQTKTLYIISDNSQTGILQKRLVKSTENLFPNFKYIYLDGSDYIQSELLERIKTIPEDAVILITIWLRDKSDAFIPVADGFPKISMASPVPVYGLADSWLGNGIVGGKVSIASLQGKAAAKMALQIMNGKLPAEIPAVKGSFDKYMFDFRQLERFHIPVAGLPEGSLVINRPVSFIRKHSRLISLSAIIIILQGLTIAILLISSSRLVKTQKSLIESEELFRLAFKTSPDAININRLNDGMYIDINDGFTSLTGFTWSDVEGKTSVDIGIWNDSEDRITLAKTLMKKGSVANLEADFKTKDGSLRRSLMSATRIILNGEAHILSITRDITELRKAEKERYQIEKRYQTLFEDSRDAAYVSSMDGKLIAANPAMEQMFGYTGDEIAEINIIDLYANPTDRKRFTDTILKEGYVKDFQVDLITKDRKELNCLVTANIGREKDGELATMEGTIRDETEKRRLEAQYQQAQKMEAVGRLAGGVAHDFNNLLTVITGNAEIGMMIQGQDNLVRRELEEILKAANRASELTRQLLAYSRKQTMIPKILNMNQIILNMSKMLKRMIGEDIVLATNTAKDLSNIKADPNQLEQVIVNLVVNARDAMPSGGKLTIETKNTDLDDRFCQNHAGFTPGEYVQISVCDTGSGMSEEIIQQIFDPFFTTKERGKGTGLGLATVYGTIKQNSGNIWVNSELNKGTTFHIFIPVVQDKDAVKLTHQSKPIKAPQGHETLLIVEDEDTVREMAVRILSDLGYNIIQNSSGTKAYAEHINNDNIDLLLTDVIMPNMSGPELVNLLREQKKDLKVLFMSGYTKNVNIQSGLLDPGIPYIQKPFRPVDLAVKVREVLDGKSSMQV